MRPQIPNQHNLREQIQAHSREPFQVLLTHVLGAEPDPATLAKWAKAHPDRWGNLLAISAKLSGFKDGVNVDINASISHLSDAEIEAEIRSRLADMTVIPQEVPTDPPEDHQTPDP